jgi:demethylmenaquinone methyltransferase/2-methoxy-6-polyprenyl-1,4-benzoquinol methylase
MQRLPTPPTPSPSVASLRSADANLPGMVKPPVAHTEFRRSNEAARELFRPLPERYDLLAELLTFGQNRRWRRRVVDEVEAAIPSTILDVATGTAGIAEQMAKRTEADVVGIDITEEMIQVGSEKVRRNRFTNRVQLVVGSGERLPFRDATFDALVSAFLLRYVPDPADTLRELARVIRPGGLMVGLELMVPPKRFWRTIWRLYTGALLPAAGGALGGRAWTEAGRFLGPSITEHYRRYPVDWHIDAWRLAGMTDVALTTMSLGGGLIMWGTRSP